MLAKVAPPPPKVVLIASTAGPPVALMVLVAPLTFTVPALLARSPAPLVLVIRSRFEGRDAAGIAEQRYPTAKDRALNGQIIKGKGAVVAIDDAQPGTVELGNRTAADECQTAIIKIENVHRLGSGMNQGGVDEVDIGRYHC